MKTSQILHQLQNIRSCVMAGNPEANGKVIDILTQAYNKIAAVMADEQDKQQSQAKRTLLRTDPAVDPGPWLEAAKTLFGGVIGIAAAIEREPKTVYGWFQGRPINKRHVEHLQSLAK